MTLRPILFAICLILVSGLMLTDAIAEKVYFAGYKGGFYIRSEEEGGMELRLGGAFQTDYRYYAESERADNGFDIRRARLRFSGQLTQHFRFGMEYEFQGNETDNLVDAYGEAVFGLSALRFGQFKEPFSLEWQSRDKALFFAERSMGYYLGPRRDIGVMFYGSAFDQVLNYNAGIFNGDGDDGSASGPEHDEPEIAGRFTVSPFKKLEIPWLRDFQFGGSAALASIDTLNIKLKVKSTGMVGTDRTLYYLTHNTKFGVIQDAGDRIRYGLETAWTTGPLLFQAEFMSLSYTDLVTSQNSPSDADVSSWYASVAWHLTGEVPILSNGVVKPIHPNTFFNPSEKTLGAFVLAARFEHFDGDEAWINPDSYVSVRDADALSVALNWILFPMVRVVLDVTRTELSDPIRVRVLEDGTTDYVDEETVVTLRYSMDF